ncbi:MAG TPA: Flp pilus assembly protein CpaB [Rhizomicrobium sp.]|nr:Flp pilus assembly protein CpaB [Rhizomicrobium sp.]
MNTQRLVILGVAALAAGAAALLARGLLGGGTQTAKAMLPPPRPATAEVLVASSDLQPGTALTPSLVRWQEWPKSSVDSSFITENGNPDLTHITQGAVVRAPLVAGQPIANTMIVHADSAGFMAASVQPGMRAVSIGINTESGAGGFILPNDRVDVLVTAQVSDSPRRFGSMTFLHDVRVLAVDQTYREDKDQKVVLAKTATLELTPRQAEKVETAQAAGTLSLSLRALGDNDTTKKPSPTSSSADTGEDKDNSTTAMTVIRYGVPRMTGSQGE